VSDLIISVAFLAFALFLVAGKYRKYAAIAGWSCIVLNLISELPAFFEEANFFYPTLALLSLPFLGITVRHLWREDPVALRLSTTAAVSTLIFVPFAVVPALRDGLITGVVNLAFSLITTLGHRPVMTAWDVMAENGFYNQIILGCTGILAIAFMLGVVSGVQGTSARQRGVAVLLIVPTLFILNLLRVSVVFIAVSDQWFTGFPDPTGTGSPDFFWAHNVIAEGLAVIFLLLFLAGLCRVLPGLWNYARDVVNLYYEAITGFVRRVVRQ